MRESRILKILCYISMPILLVALAISIFSIMVKENIYYDEERYFTSDSFTTAYMTYLSSCIKDLIHNNESYYCVQDGEKAIYYSNAQKNYFTTVKDKYFLIIYQNKALTNVELTEKTNTIDEIKSYINGRENAKHVNIIHGNIESDSEIIQEIGSQYLDYFTEPYYSVHSETENTSQYVEYFTAYPRDFEIYSSYIEEFAETSQASVVNKFFERFHSFETYSYFVIPASAVLIILILIYLIISIGYKKGEKGISLNDFDKIPLEIIIFLAIIIGCIPFIPLESIEEDYNAILSLVMTGFLVIYILSAIVLDTTIKRIKSKTLLKSTIIGKIIIWLAKCLEYIGKKIKVVWNTLTYSTSANVKVVIYILLFGSISIFNLCIFYANPGLAIILELVMISIIIYKVMKYINNISNGLENAIQDRMKSERLKAELITNVSHDIKTPLTSIINYVDLLKQENIENEKAKEYIGILDNKSQRLKRLTEDLVEASKVSTGNISLNLEKINIVELIKQAVGEFEDKFQKRGLKTIIDSKENEINIMADSRYMYRIIENLFSNVSKYALENSRVYIDIRKKAQKELTLITDTEKEKKYKKGSSPIGKVAQCVVVEVKNISQDRLNISADELMQRFVRGDKSRTTEGSGLGISIAQNLTELQNGQFNLKLDGDLFKVELTFEIEE